MPRQITISKVEIVENHQPVLKVVRQLYSLQQDARMHFPSDESKENDSDQNDEFEVDMIFDNAADDTDSSAKSKNSL